MRARPPARSPPALQPVRYRVSGTALRCMHLRGGARQPAARTLPAWSASPFVRSPCSATVARVWCQVRAITCAWPRRAGKAGAIVGAFGFGELVLTAGIQKTLGVLAITNFLGRNTNPNPGHGHGPLCTAMRATRQSVGQ